MKIPEWDAYTYTRVFAVWYWARFLDAATFTVKVEKPG